MGTVWNVHRGQQSRADQEEPQSGLTAALAVWLQESSVAALGPSIPAATGICREWLGQRVCMVHTRYEAQK